MPDHSFCPIGSESSHSSNTSSSSTATRTPCLSLESDVVIVVGGVEFEENSYLLRSCSDYFDVAFGSGMKEALEMRFEFPDKDPREWELIRELLTPFSSQRITWTNVRTVLPWLDALCIPRGLEQCDRVLLEQLGGQRPGDLPPRREDRLARLQDWLHLLLEGLKTSTLYDLRRSKGFLLDALNAVVQDHPVLLGANECQTLADLMATDEECKRELWDKVSVYLRLDVTNPTVGPTEKVLSSPSDFSKALQTGIRTNRVVSELTWLEKKALAWLQSKSKNKKMHMAQDDGINEVVFDSHDKEERWCGITD